MTCYMHIKNEQIGRIEIFEIYMADLLSRDNNNEWKNQVYN